MMKRDLKADLEILTGDWGAHESDWFRDNSVAIATHAIERTIEAEALARELVESIVAIETRIMEEAISDDRMYYRTRIVLEDITRIIRGSKAKEVLGDEQA